MFVIYIIKNKKKNSWLMDFNYVWPFKGDRKADLAFSQNELLKAV